MGKTRQIKKNVEKTQGQEQIIKRNELKTFAFVIIVVAVIFLVFYGITLLVKPGEVKKETGILQENIQYNEIMVGQILNRKDKEYFVLLKESDNLNNALYLDYLEIYSNDKGIYYTANLNHSFNQNYISDLTEVKGQDVSKFKFNDTTLIKIKDNKVNKVYTTHDEIVAALEKLI